jgi:DNA-binding NarL/FixJ family response regulator
MLDVESCKILIVGSCIFRRGVASIVRDVVQSASIVETSCFADARARLNRCEFFAAIFDIDADELNGPISFRTVRVDCPHLILGVLSRTASPSDILSYLAAGVTGYVLEKSGQTEVERAFRQILNGAIYIPPNVIEPTACEPEFALLLFDTEARWGAQIVANGLFQQGNRATTQSVSTHGQNSR